ncbi:acyl-CoA desaturase [candidate division KSB1 bacterium]
MAIAIFFISHWFLSLFFQTFFLHRYAAHGMFRMSKFWERFFYFMTFISQGSSFLNPRAYAILHRMHHAHSDSQKDPHSPHHSKNIIQMMKKTYDKYIDIQENKSGKQFNGRDYPAWVAFEKFTPRWGVRLLFGAAYIVFYIVFAPNQWVYLLLPVHFLMGPIHGAIVNWFGHKWGYVNFRETKDYSRNTLPVDFLMLGELFQNNHHRFPMKPNFANKWFEFDPSYIIIKFMSKLRIIKFESEILKMNNN